MKAYREIVGIALLFLEPLELGEVDGQLHALAILPL
jgi:hypothetical protein